MSVLERLFGIALPILQAPMAGVQGSELAVAVAEAGGLGALPCAMLSPGAIGDELTRIRAKTSAPVNVNFFCHAQAKPDASREAAWRATLAPYYAELGLDVTAIPDAAARTPFDETLADVVAPFRPEVVSFHFGLPSAALLARVRAWGGKVISSATTVEEALALEAAGVDAIIAQGADAGGHRGMFLTTDIATQRPTGELLPAIVRAVHTPVIAAGGISTASRAAEMIALGAAGVQIGTAYLLCPEAKTSAVHRAALASEASRRTVLTNVFTGRPARAIVNRILEDLGPIRPDAPAFPLAAGALAPLRAQAERMGSGDFSPLWSGTDTSGCRAVPAGEITRQLGEAARAPR